MRNTTTSEALTPSTMNIATKEDASPANAVNQLKYLKLGRKFGAEPIFNRKQARLVTMKVIRNAMVMNVAIWLMLANRHSCVSSHVSRMALIGLFDSLVTFSNGFKNWKMLSLAMACSTPAAPTIPTMMENRLVDSSPMKINCADRFTSWIIVMSFLSNSLGTQQPSAKITKA
ncbi:hypothetical protein WICPIJ_009729 [Wickerhamomyces pijperi]|uniref:Uncharacterized protein n=1 Tax=Wickerhamomyces pijperi TaxID=599730 RepID=A0A9P8PKN7_WICPI|nr:hypothetical protein WICPIJ_009729 [Wickerhamomyces pijperi]